jgi:phosphatidylinositol kinase/protein kinase (PI-3  family)
LFTQRFSSQHDDKKLPIEISSLALYAAKCHAYAKALHYKEAQFHVEPSTENIEHLIAIYNQLKQPEAATGLLVFAKKNDKDMRIQVRVQPSALARSRGPDRNTASCVAVARQ